MKYDVYQTTLYIYKNFQNKKMKTIILFSVLFLSLVSCTNEESNYITVNGRVEREINGEGVPNQLVILIMQQTHGTGYWSYKTEIDYKQVTTDSEGNFSVSMKNDSNTSLSGFKPQDDNYTQFQLNSVDPNKNIVIKINKFIKFKIYVNNTNPFDVNDFVSISFASGLPQNFRTKIENFGNTNTIHPAENLPGGGGVGAYEDASWKGTNVNSIVYYNVPENADNHKIVWYKQKNGTETKGVSPEIPFQPNQINEYHFDY
jgi:hypothetical protein